MAKKWAKMAEGVDFEPRGGNIHMLVCGHEFALSRNDFFTTYAKAGRVVDALGSAPVERLGKRRKH